MVGIVYIGQIELSPFVKKYISVLREENIDYEIIHWNRSGIKMPDDDENYTYTEKLDRYGNLIFKLAPFLKFRRYMKKIIRNKRYERLIVLTTQTALMIPMLLIKKYKNKYYFDYRDTSYEYIRPYKYMVDKIINMSAYTCISSPGFAEYLTNKKELILSHNIQYNNYSNRIMSYKRNIKNKIIIGYIGYLREYDYLIKFVDIFGNDKRFEFRIHGSGDCVEKLKEYAEKYDNVNVYGAYDESDKMSIVDSFDMICYNYPENFVNYPALANKFYDGLIRKKPMFGNLNTYSGKLIDTNYLGISLRENEDKISDKIFDYYMNIDEEKFLLGCEDFLKKVIDEDAYYIKSIRAFLNE